MRILILRAIIVVVKRAFLSIAFSRFGSAGFRSGGLPSAGFGKMRSPVSRWLAAAVLLVLFACGNPTEAGFEVLPAFLPRYPDDLHYGYAEAKGTFSEDARQWPLQAIHMSQAWGTLFADEVARSVGRSPFPRHHWR